MKLSDLDYLGPPTKINLRNIRDVKTRRNEFHRTIYSSLYNITSTEEKKPETTGNQCLQLMDH